MAGGEELDGQGRQKHQTRTPPEDGDLSWYKGVCFMLMLVRWMSEFGKFVGSKRRVSIERINQDGAE